MSPPPSPLPAALDLQGHVILMADDHYGSRGRHGLASALRDVTGREVVDIEAANGLAESDVEGAGLIAMYHNYKRPSAKTEAVLLSWVEQRKPLLLAHAGIGSYRDWPQYQQWCGRVWNWEKSKHPYEPSMLLAKSGAGFPWAEAWLPKDEVFTLLDDRSEVTDLCVVRIENGDHPAAWICKRWPNIAAWLPGHREDLYLLPAMRDGLRAMIQNALCLVA